MGIARIVISDLQLRTIIGTNSWEREKAQDVILNLEFCYDAGPAVASDNLQDTIDYKALKRKIMGFVEGSRFQLLERLAHEVLQIVMTDPRVLSAVVRIEKPHALRFARSVAVEMRSGGTEKPS